MFWVILGFLLPPLVAAVATLWFAHSALTAAVSGALGGLAALCAIQFFDRFVTNTARFHGGVWCIKGSHFSPWFAFFAMGSAPILGGALAGVFAHLSPGYFGLLTAVFVYVVAFLPLQLLVQNTFGDHTEWVRLTMAVRGRGPECGPMAVTHTVKCMQLLGDYGANLIDHPEEHASTVGEYQSLLVQLLIVRGFLFGLPANLVYEGVKALELPGDEDRRAWLERPLTPEVLEEVSPVYDHLVTVVHEVQDIVRHQEADRSAVDEVRRATGV